MNQLSNAAKAASILHHTWGVEGAKAAVALYDALDALNDEEFDTALTNAEGWGIYEPYQLMSSSLIWDNIYSLAESIDTCMEELQ